MWLCVWCVSVKLNRRFMVICLFSSLCVSLVCVLLRGWCVCLLIWCWMVCYLYFIELIVL